MSVEELAAAIGRLSRPLLVACDVDGTLAPIVDDPAAARVPPSVARDLRTLAARRGVHVALVTGRDAGALARLVRVPGAWRALEHGARLVAPRERAARRRLSPAELARLGAFEAWALERAVPHGAELEHKPESRALHVRTLARRQPALARRLLREASAAARRSSLSPRAGRAVLEAELRPGDKGDALSQLVRAARCRGVVYVGDDLTDVPAIRRAVELGGIGLFVRSAERPRAPRGATASLAGPAEVAALLSLLARAPLTASPRR